MSCSARAVVGGALVPGDPDEAVPRGGMRPTENREVVEMRDARDPGRRGGAEYRDMLRNGPCVVGGGRRWRR